MGAIISKILSSIFSWVVGNIPPKTILIVISVLIALGAFFWFKHSIYENGRKDERAACNAEKHDEFMAQIETDTENRILREATDEKIRKMSLTDIDRALSDNGWLRD